MPTQNPWAWAWVWAPNVGLYKEAPNVTLFCQKVGGDADVIHRICCPSGPFHPYYLLLSHLHYKFWEKIATLSSVIMIIMREFYTMEIGFTLLSDNIKVFY